MAWQRKIPFGYRMKNGEIAPHPEEAEAVAFIYDSYIQGESYLRIAAAMGELGIRYHEATPVWNKHMVKRMLENPVYTGQKSYPAILSSKTWSAAQEVRQSKTKDWQGQSRCVELLKRRMVCAECGTPFNKNTPTNTSGNRWWNCGNPECACALKIRDGALEEAVASLLNRLITQPELLDQRESGGVPLSMEAVRMQNEISRELSKTELNQDYLTALIFACAAEKYAMLDDCAARGKAARLKAKLQMRSLPSAFDPTLFEEAAEALLVSANGALALRLTGGNIIIQPGKEPTTYADSNHESGHH